MSESVSKETRSPGSSVYQAFHIAMVPVNLRDSSTGMRVLPSRDEVRQGWQSFVARLTGN